VSWLFERHCRGARHERMRELLSLMERNAESGDPTSYADFRELLGPRGYPYRTFYAAEANGFCRPILVPKARVREGSARSSKSFVITEKGSAWLREQDRFVESLSRAVPKGPPGRRGRRPGEGMAPMRQADLRLAARRRDALERARAGMRSRTGGGK
jgi:hypothetical protein